MIYAVRQALACRIIQLKKQLVAPECRAENWAANDELRINRETFLHGICHFAEVASLPGKPMLKPVIRINLMRLRSMRPLECFYISPELGWVQKCARWHFYGASILGYAEMCFAIVLIIFNKIFGMELAYIKLKA